MMPGLIDAGAWVACSPPLGPRLDSRGVLIFTQKRPAWTGPLSNSREAANADILLLVTGSKGTARPAKRPVSPKSLEWARSRAQLSHADVAEKLGRRTIDASTVAGWERGEGQPSPAQVRLLAKIFRIPERWLYYDEPPRAFDDLGLVDFRTSDQRPLTALSLNLRSAIEHALAIQAWVAEHRARNEYEPVALVGAKKFGRVSARAVADFLREELDVEALRDSAQDAEAFFKALRASVEERGVLVLRMGHVANKTAWPLDPTEFKGFTLIDEDRLAPLIFINRKDLADAQLFTLVHELTHVVTGGSGVSNEDIADFAEDKPDIERFCDEVADELLVPAAQFEQAWGERAKGLRARVETVAKQLKVPPVLAGRRAVTFEQASPSWFHRFVAAERAQPSAAKKPGGSQYSNLPTWYGRDLVRLLASAATTEHPAGVDALELLGVSFDTALELVRPERARSGSPALPRMERLPLIEIDDSWRAERR